jgi:hypothetical protein
MSTPQQIQANQANAKKSTGPRTSEGKAAAARNAFTHGLSATPESLFANCPILADEFRAFAAALRADYGPQVAALEPLFDRMVFAQFQLKRAQSYEARAETDMINDFGNPDLEKRWMRFAQMRLRLSREAAAAQKDYHTLKTYFAHCEAIQESHRTRAQADRQFQNAFGPDPLLAQTNPKRMDDLFNRFQEALISIAKPQARTQTRT